MRGSLLVVASLLASVTYQAGLNPPGGMWQDTSPEGTQNPHRAGNPVLQDTNSARFQLFNLFNSFAFAHSVGVMMHLLTESVVDGWRGGPRTSRRFRSLLGFGSVRTMKYMMILSLLYLAVAFAAGSCRNWWCSLSFVFSPMLYFLSCVAFDLFYYISRRRQEKKLVPAPAGQQVEVAVEHHIDRSAMTFNGPAG